MLDKEEIRAFVETYLDKTSCYLTDLSLSKDNEIVIVLDNDEGVDLDTCAALTHAFQERFDREKEDYSLEVGSAGLTSPLKVLRQYRKNVGNDVEVLTKDGRKLKGRLKEADEQRFVLTIEKKEKPEGAKRPIMVEEDLAFTYEEVKTVCQLLKV
ncbi:MAG: ribosome assembly cofactor RimP [Paludibacteraceae bacterium]|nr:ribosome assembly cofactor RimP [Paludibacteraceae bacterium]